MISGFLLMLIGLLADLIAVNRRLMEDLIDRYDSEDIVRRDEDV